MPRAHSWLGQRLGKFKSERWVKTWEEDGPKKDGKKAGETGIGENVNALVNAHQRAPILEEGLKNQGHNDPTFRCQPVSFASSSVLARWRHEQSGHNGRDRGYSCAVQYRLPPHKANLATDVLMYVQPANSREKPTLSPRYGIILRGYQALLSGRFIALQIN